MLLGVERTSTRLKSVVKEMLEVRVGWLPHSEDGVLPQPPGGRAGHHLDRREEVVVLHSLSRPPEYQLLHLTSVALDHHPAIRSFSR